MSVCFNCPVAAICAQKYFKKPCPIPYEKPEPKKEEMKNENSQL